MNCVTVHLQNNMTYDIDWIIPRLRSPTKLWQFASAITIFMFALFTKIVIDWFNNPVVYNSDIIKRALDDRPKNVPLITIANHYSYIDDPGVWVSLRWGHLCSRRVLRWTLAAHDFCFTNSWHSYIFSLAKCVPIIRGNGIHQDAIDFCIERLANGQWVHLFPEGRLNHRKEIMQLKWGIGRLIYESPVTPIVIPIWLIGMDDICPYSSPYNLKLGRKVTINYGEPIDFTDIIQSLREKGTTFVEARKALTDHIQNVLLKLKRETEPLHIFSLQ